jgi:hypothetical protein
MLCGPYKTIEMRDPFPGEVVLNGSSQDRIDCTRLSSSIAPIASSQDLGSVSMLGAGITRLHTRFQTSLATKVWSHHRLQRPRVRRLRTASGQPNNVAPSSEERPGAPGRR